MRAELEALVEKLTASADKYDESERLAETESDRRFYAGAASARWEDVKLLSAILSREKEPPEEGPCWNTVIVGLPIIRKLLNGEDVTLETFKVNLIPDDVLWNGA